MIAAGKSGTTTKNVDVWFVGYTPYYTAGVWAGCDDNQSLNDGQTGQYNGGTSFHKDIWKKIMDRVHQDLDPIDAFPVPEGIVQLKVCRKSGMLPKSACSADVRSGSCVLTFAAFLFLVICGGCGRRTYCSGPAASRA